MKNEITRDEILGYTAPRSVIAANQKTIARMIASRVIRGRSTGFFARVQRLVRRR